MAGALEWWEQYAAIGFDIATKRRSGSFSCAMILDRQSSGVLSGWHVWHGHVHAMRHGWTLCGTVQVSFCAVYNVNVKAGLGMSLIGIKDTSGHELDWSAEHAGVPGLEFDESS